MESGFSWWTVLALLLVVEGLLPFASPRYWRATLIQLLALRDGQIRAVGLLCIAVGLSLLWWLE
ncbi:DUF2065 domain-containing protein [Comamonas aquatica]|uniref:DUF2065 domain-containing protein n=1 Tax=Comamonas aquatica TaxID=225991 RepID=UPI002446CFCC|nr:DUF2065 domain-containing protein [Comamonas aquatica]MDH0201260.1 DUF2065 domain-containing protein [Comamonas aquatica]MDH1445392.1 DUF2065 domain-containing protein [Comamonas aquatica]MDH1814723.1 DUF2065 domain-containing protein [Comamonas aquatica]